MNVSCHGCGRHFRVRQDRLPAQGARTRCPRCDEVLIIAPPREDAAEGGDGAAAAAPSQGELFDLPAADLTPIQDDLFALDEEAGPGAAATAAAAPDAPEGAAASATDQAGGADPGADPVRRRGFRGWLARLFGRGS